MKNLIKLKNKFLQADNETYFETKLVVTYICILTSLFQRAILKSEIPCIRLPKNKRMYKKSDVLKWVQENIQEINPTFQNPKTSAWLEQWINDKFSNSTSEATKKMSNSKKGDLS